MRLNIFRIPSDQRSALRKKLAENGLSSTRKLKQDGWVGDFLFCPDPPPGVIPWVKTFSEYLGSRQDDTRSYFAIVLAKNDSTYAIALGKTHFFVRPHCDYDFGIELAKRIADEDDVVTSVCFAGTRENRRKESEAVLAGHARLSVPPGNSVDFLQGKVIFPGKVLTRSASSGKFGTSCSCLTPDIAPEEIGVFPVSELQGLSS